jgi:hypothetical protein
MSNNDNKNKQEPTPKQGNSNQPQQPLRDTTTYIERGQKSDIKK